MSAPPYELHDAAVPGHCHWICKACGWVGLDCPSQLDAVSEAEHHQKRRHAAGGAS